MTAEETARAAVNSVVHAASRYEPVQKRLAEDRPDYADMRAWFELTLELARVHEDVFVACRDLARVLAAYPEHGLADSVVPECQLVAERVAEVPSPDALLCALSMRRSELERVLSITDSLDDSDLPDNLSEQLAAQFGPVRDAAIMLTNQVRAHNAQLNQWAFAEAARRQGLSVYTSETRADDGSTRSVVSVSFERSQPPARPRWWHRFIRRAQ